MEAGLIASIFTCSWGVLLYGATTDQPSSATHIGGLVAIIAGAVVAVLVIAGHVIATHHQKHHNYRRH